jgi:hypothetical protein
MGNKLAQLVDTLGKIDVPKDTNTTDYPFWVDGIPVVKGLLDFCLELRKKYPQVKYHANHELNRIIRIGNTPPAYSDVTVYVDNCEVILGYVGYGTTYGVELRADNMYVVTSRHIANNKYSEHRDQHHRMFTADITKAVKTARSALLPYSAKELLAISVEQYKNTLNNNEHKYESAQRDLLRPLTYSDEIAAELVHLVRQGVQFTTPKFIAAAAEFTRVHDAVKQAKQRLGDSYFVSLRMVGDVPYADICEVDKVKTLPYGMYNKVATPENMKSIPASDLPEDIQGKVAVLSILNNDQYVESVGYKVSPRMFWLERS